MPLTRRELLRLLGVAAVWPGCGDNLAVRPPGPEHASAVLEPDGQSFVVAVWSRLARGAAIDVVTDRGTPAFSTSVDLDDSLATVHVTGLEPGAGYLVLITCDDGVRMGPHRVRTAPAPDDTRAVRLGVSADVDPNPEFKSDLLEQLAMLSPDLYVSIGDFPYTDNGPPAMTVPTYRERHAQLRTEPRVRRFLESVGVRAIYDDHEFRNDWDAMFEAAEADRFAAAMQVWDEFFPLPALAGTDIRYRRWRWGAHVECFLLDCRRFRSANASPDGPAKTMLGATQRAWLETGVRASPAPFKLIFTSVPLDYGMGNDHWASFAYERDSILDALVGVPGVLFISGDQHLFAAHRHAHGVREFQVGPVARGLGMATVDAPGVLFRAIRYNAGLIDVDAGQLTFSGIGAGGEVFYRETFTPADLTPLPAR